MSIKKFYSIFIFSAFIFSLFAATIFGQKFEEKLSGNVVDQNGGALSGASVILRNEDTGLERFTSTDAQGKFSFGKLGENNSYQIIVSADGFKRTTVDLSNRKDLTVTLEVAPLQTQTTVFSGSRQEELRESLNTKVEVVTHSQIRDTGYESAGEVLREVPGVLTRRGSDTGTSSNPAGEQIQGIGSRQSLVLIDNFPVIGARGIKSGVINLDRQSTARLEQIEVVKGASSALYGTDSIGGVVNLITREPQSPFEGAVTISGGNFGIFDPRAELGFKRGKFGSFFDVERHKNNGFDLTPTTFDTTGAGFHRYDFFNKSKYDFTNNFSLTSLINVYRNNALGRSIGERGFQTDDTEETAQSYGLTANWTINPRTALQTRGYFSRYDEISKETLVSGTRAPDDNLFERFGQVDANLLYVLGERQLLQIGGEFTTDRYRGINRLRNDSGERADTRVLWGQDKINLTKWATLTLGLRYDNHSIFGSAFSPKAGLNIRVNENLNVRASFGRGFRAPDLGQLYFRFFNPTNLYQVIGNPNLSPEHSGSWQAGADYHSRENKYRFGVNFFRNDVRNLIEAQNYGFILSNAQLNGVLTSQGISPQDFRLNANTSLFRLLFIYQNLSNIYTQGVEFDGDIQLPKDFAVSGAYTYLDARDKTSGAYLAERNKHQAFLKLAYNNQKLGFRGNLRGSYFSHWLTSTTTNRGLTIPAVAPSFTLWDVYGAKTFKKNYEVFASIDNLFDNQDGNVGRVDAVTGQPLPLYRLDAGRMFRIGMRVSFGRER